MEAGARPAPLPGSLGPISSGCFQAGPSRGRGKGTGSLFPSKGSRVSLPEPPPPCSGQPLIPPCQSCGVYSLPVFWGQGQWRDLRPQDLLCPPQAHLEAILVLGVGVDGDPRHRPSGPESPSLKVLVTGVAEDLPAVAVFMYCLLPTPASLCIHARPWICSLGSSNSGASFSLINEFIYNCTGSSLLCTGFLWLGPAGTALSLRCKGCSLWWLLSLQSTGSRRAGFRSRGTQAQWLRLEGLVAPRNAESSQTRDRIRVPALAGGLLSTMPPGKF